MKNVYEKKTRECIVLLCFSPSEMMNTVLNLFLLYLLHGDILANVELEIKCKCHTSALEVSGCRPTYGVM